MIEYLLNETWAPINNWGHIYSISNFGRVKSLSRKIKCKNNGIRTTKEKIIKPVKNKFGYYRILLHDNHKVVAFNLHRLIAIHFIPNPDNKTQINHIDGNPSNNSIENLEWCTPSENIQHSFKVLKRKPSGMALGGRKWTDNKKGINHHKYGVGNTNALKGKDHPNSKRIKCCTLDIEFDSIKIASDLLGLHTCQVSNVLLGKYRHTHGLTFIYL